MYRCQFHWPKSHRFLNSDGCEMMFEHVFFVYVNHTLHLPQFRDCIINQVLYQHISCDGHMTIDELKNRPQTVVSPLKIKITWSLYSQKVFFCFLLLLSNLHIFSDPHSHSCVKVLHQYYDILTVFITSLCMYLYFRGSHISTMVYS